MMCEEDENVRFESLNKSAELLEGKQLLGACVYVCA